jgi:hypothetical protein
MLGGPGPWAAPGVWAAEGGSHVCDNAY